MVNVRGRKKWGRALEVNLFAYSIVNIVASYRYSCSAKFCAWGIALVYRHLGALNGGQIKTSDSSGLTWCHRTGRLNDKGSRDRALDFI